MPTLEEGLAAFEAENYREAFEILLPLAQEGELKAQKCVAAMYNLGYGVERDLSKAAQWYRPVAEHGDPIAQNNLGMFLLEEDPKEAIKWLVAAAKQNIPFSQSVLADIYSGEIQLPGLKEKVLNDAEALKLYMKAARQNDPMASHRLGDMYATGQGVEQDEAEALKWYEKAAEEDYSTSQRLLAQAYQEGRLGLTPDPEKAKYWLDRALENES